MEKIYFLTSQEIINIHKQLINLYGGSHGIRDIALLESAVYQPQSSFSGKYLHTNIYEMAAAYLYHIVKNHPFIDGNKRTGLFSALTFLKYNELEINVRNEQLYKLTMDVAKSKKSKKEIAAFFKKNVFLN